jgi:catechol 2,3-dioxygenase-like lactoylglutathione lyase family enzyme
MQAQIEKISAITLRVSNMEAALRFYCDLLGLQLVFGGPQAPFSSLRTRETEFPILNLERGPAVKAWGRMIFHVSDVDQFWALLQNHGCHPQHPQDASWGERYFHALDPDGNELSFARPLQGKFQVNGEKAKNG